MKINFISNLPLSEISGGFSGMNRVAHDALKEIAEINYAGPVNPPVFLHQKISSKLKKSVGLPHPFFFFSEARLQHCATEVAANCDASASLDFYHGFTPWILCKTSRPYIAWSDCSFRDYISIYHDPKSFCAKDVTRICAAEAGWMKGAECMLFSSEWARARTEKDYRLDPRKTGSVGIFGAMEPPEQDTWSGAKDFYFVSTDYKRKNGALCRKAMDIVWRTHPDARLRIIGAEPPESDLLPGKVTYEGFFRKSDPEQLRRFRTHLANAFALIHPTDADTTAMILIEAAFFGCPAVSVNDFAIPEVIGSNTYLLSRPITPEAIAAAMEQLLSDENNYLHARTRARKAALQKHTMDLFKERLQAAVSRVAKLMH